MQRLRTLHLFAGAGGGILADILLGHQPVCAVEIDEYCQQVLSARQKDGCLPWFPIFADVTQFDGRPWRGIIDVVSGGFPCQDISAAGKGAGIEGAKSGLWLEMARIIGEVRPRYAFVENSPMLTSRGLGVVLGDLAAMGFDARWGVIDAASVGAPHLRERIWIVAHAKRAERWPQGSEHCGDRWRLDIDGLRERGKMPSRTRASSEMVSDANGSNEHGRRGAVQVGRKWSEGKAANDGDAARAEWRTEPGVGGKVDGLA